MAKRALKNKKIRIIAIGAALSTGAAIVSFLPSANAADEKTPEEIMVMCNRAEFINGEKQSLRQPVGDNFLADTCDFVETKFETFNGPTVKQTQDFSNCEPNATKPATVTAAWTESVAQGQGTYSVTQQGASGGLFGFLTGAWKKHKATLDMTIKEATVSESELRSVPVGKVLHVEFTPKMQRMTGVWKVHLDARAASLGVNAQPEKNFEAPEVVEGPVVLGSAAGAPGIADGISKAVLTDC
ncbi:hypothetical protein [Streptomyces sp. NL15-2K]|uniref:hypothetical protein n=1 Tax=Streptomyces sp. NL15-2K TaxID=376149 RepID=UPI000FFA5460|nr:MULTISPECIES: hypothetical protein [Actinomycetes]WKX10134.1 hypothetical protein Q4V64_22595 [Kutzneria buriramensis]GCB48374.1 hypothetical protein SNL152K_5698 [Streptomyces sp. NL15-2K]